MDKYIELTQVGENEGKEVIIFIKRITSYCGVDHIGRGISKDYSQVCVRGTSYNVKETVKEITEKIAKCEV